MDAIAPPPIEATDAYNEGLAKGLEEKLFFLAHLWKFPHEDATFVDFGCGDGTVLEAVHQRYPNASLFGIERDPKQRELARKRLRHKAQVLASLDEWQPRRNSPTVLILSSVLHEVVSYGGTLSRFWEDVEALGFEVIAIRDMSLNLERWTYPTHDLAASKVVSKADPAALRAFWRRWGPFRNSAHLMHFVLKYRFYQGGNWEREIEENYLSVPYELLLQTVMGSGRYAPVHVDHHVPQHLQDYADSTFELVFSAPTHVTMILEKT